MIRLLDYAQRAALVACIIISVPVAYGVGIEWVQLNRSVTIAGAVVLFSPIAMFALRVIEVYGHENRRAVDMFDPSRQSWAFTFGDTFLLSYAMIALTRGRQGVPGFFGDYWGLISLGVGTALSIVFRMVDKQRYVNAGVPEALYSPTKLWHDFAVFPVVLSLLVYTGVPQLRSTEWSFHTLIGLLALLGLLALCVADAARDKNGTLDPADQHFGYDPLRVRLATN